MSSINNESSSENYRVLVADDNGDILKAMRLLLKSEGIACKCCESPGEAMELLHSESFDLALIDLNYQRDTTSGIEGLELVKSIRKFDTYLPIVIMTAWASVQIAVDCMRNGANDFVQKPWEDERLISIVNTQIQFGRILRKSEKLEEENRLLKNEGKVDFIAKSGAMEPVMDILERIGPSDANVFISGENGVGKGVFAKAMHEVSLRREKSFIGVNMGGLPEGVFESEMFGHIKGSFTDAKKDRIGRFEMADGGTLFLDEIANMPVEQQQKILRVLESSEFERVGSTRTQKVDVRILSATNSDLDLEVKEGRFRMDLQYRLNTIKVDIPPLRERQEDIPLLADFFLDKYRDKYRKSLSGFSDTAASAMKAYGWPGNVREMDHAIERAALMARGSEVDVTDLALSKAPGGSIASSLDDMSLEDVEVYLMKRALARCDGKAAEAAKAIGLSRSAFYRRLQRYGL